MLIRHDADNAAARRDDPDRNAPLRRDEYRGFQYRPGLFVYRPPALRGYLTTLLNPVCSPRSFITIFADAACHSVPPIVQIERIALDERCLQRHFYWNQTPIGDLAAALPEGPPPGLAGGEAEGLNALFKMRCSEAPELPRERNPWPIGQVISSSVRTCLRRLGRSCPCAGNKSRDRSAKADCRR